MNLKWSLAKSEGCWELEAGRVNREGTILQVIPGIITTKWENSFKNLNKSSFLLDKIPCRSQAHSTLLHFVDINYAKCMEDNFWRGEGKDVDIRSSAMNRVWIITSPKTVSFHPKKVFNAYWKPVNFGASIQVVHEVNIRYDRDNHFYEFELVKS